MTTPNPSLADLAARFWDFQRREYPLLAIQAGVPTEAEQLLYEAPADHLRRAAWAAAAHQDVSAIDAGSLGVQDRATRVLLLRELDALIELVGRQAHLRPPLYPAGPEFELISWASGTALATPDDARRYLARLASVPASLQSVMSALGQGAELGLSYPRLVIQGAVAQVRGHVSMPVEESAFYAPLGRIAGRGGVMKSLADEGRALIEDRIAPAFRVFADHLQAVLLPVSRESIACTDDIDGERFYRFNIDTFTSVDLDPAEIHAIGLSEVGRITAEMLVVCAGAGQPEDLAGFRRRLQADNRQFAESAEALREQFEILSKRIDARIPEFFGRIPRTTYGVSSIPVAVAEKLPPAYAQPNAADGSTAGVHWVTSIPDRCPRYMHLPLALHEAWPGHLMHLALVQEMEHLPDFRRYGSTRYSACLEGWALYCERLGEEMGFYDTPEKRYGRLETEMWRAVRLVVDTGIHAKGWSREEAIGFFQAHMAMPPETVRAEVDRYIGYPGQALAYQLGNLKFRELRERAESTLGDAFRVRDFHDALMAMGPVTLPVLEMLIDDWIETVRTSEVA